MTLPIILVSAVIVCVILLFIFEFVRVDIVGILMMTLLPLLGLITPKEAVSGLSSNTVIIVVSVIIFATGLEKTGAMHSLARFLLKLAARSETAIMLLITVAVSFFSGFMQNINAAALFMPAAKRISRQAEIPIARILMPMGFSAIIGGCLTLIGSNPLILLNDIMKAVDPEVESYGLFAVTPIGLSLILAYLLYLLLFGNLILPTGRRKKVANGPMSKNLQRTYHDIGNFFELSIPHSFAGPQKLVDLEIRAYYFTTVIAVVHEGGSKNFAPDVDTELRGGDTIAVEGPPELVKKLAAAYKWDIKDDLSVFAEELSPDNAGVIEAIISPRSEMARSTLRSFSFRQKYGVNPLALRRGNKTFVGGISDIILQTGDTLLLQGRWDKFHFLKDQLDLIFTEDVRGEIRKTEKLKYAVGSMLLSLALIIVFKIQISIALLAGAVGIILTDVLSIDDAYESIDWMTVFLLAGMIPLGIAFEKTGAAGFFAAKLSGVLGQLSPLLLLALLGLFTSFFTLVISNIVTVVLMIPLAMKLAMLCGTDPRTAALVVAISCSNNFILPTHQVNSLVFQPGGYRNRDYFKAGSGITVLFFCVMLAMVSLFYVI